MLTEITLDKLYKDKNKILIYRNIGGLGDILMHRMIFEDFKILDKECHITFACPKKYHLAAIDHPHIDLIIDSKSLDFNNYITWFNTTNICGRYESFHAPFCIKNRADIWAEHCGVSLTKHEMHFNFSDDEIKEAKNIISNLNLNKEKIIIFCPYSAIPSKNLTTEQILEIYNYFKNSNYELIVLHNKEIDYIKKLKIKTINNINLRQWMSIINIADYVITVDTAAFHMAGGLKKPMTAVFGWSDGKIYGKYYNFNLVQKHRDEDKNWTCGPCYLYGNCPFTKNDLKPCIEKINIQSLIDSIEKMLNAASN
jgi:ADP-heptose:LPS heptosyltransferase